jgi:hypothetical protein
VHHPVQKTAFEVFYVLANRVASLDVASQ